MHWWIKTCRPGEIEWLAEFHYGCAALDHCPLVSPVLPQVVPGTGRLRVPKGALFCRGDVREDSGEHAGGQGRKRGCGREELSAASREASANPREDPKDELVLPNCPKGDSQDFQLQHCGVGIWVAHHSFHQKAFFYFVTQEECHHQQRQRMTPGWTHRIKEGESWKTISNWFWFQEKRMCRCAVDTFILGRQQLSGAENLRGRFLGHH